LRQPEGGVGAAPLAVHCKLNFKLALWHTHDAAICGCFGIRHEDAVTRVLHGSRTCGVKSLWMLWMALRCRSHAACG